MAERGDERERRQFVIEATSAPPHPVFEGFGTWEGWADPGWDINFLGVRTRVSFFSLYEQLADFSTRRWVAPGHPIPNEDYFEWITLLEAVCDADDSFTIVELGAGWGKWIVNGVAALRSCGDLPYQVVGVEAEPTHFHWMQQHLEDNDVDLRRATLIEAAVAEADGSVSFHVGDAADWYGQAIAGGDDATAPGGSRGIERVRAVCVPTVLQALKHVDLLDVDIQGAEADALEPAADALDALVKRAYVATHDRENEERLRVAFSDLGWESIYDFPGEGVSETRWGRVMFEDGVQLWLNPKL
jgi:FkbM family methyltransferase